MGIYAVVLFSGGRDSSLVACKLANQNKRIVLLHCQNGATIGNEIAKIRHKELKRRFTKEIKDYVEIATYGLFRKIAINTLEDDFRHYSSSLVCLGCKLAAHTMAIIYCLNNGIGIIADGYTAYQSKEYMEQRPEAIEIIKNFCAEYGILYINPIYDYKNKKMIKYDLFEYGISTKSLEGACLFGDSYMRAAKKDVIGYLVARLDICRKFIKERIHKEEDMRQKEKIHKIGAIIVKEKNILVVRKHVEGRTEYIIPGGKPEGNETHEETLERELKEELDVRLLQYRPFGAFSETAVFENVPIFMDVYYVEIDGNPEPNSEIKEVVWIDRNYEKQNIRLGTVLSRHVIPKLINEGLM